jgi:hypothetical protein
MFELQRWMGTHMKSRSLLVAAAVFSLGIGPAVADTDSDARVTKLEQTVQRLEQRVASLEAQLHVTSAPISAVPPLVTTAPEPASVAPAQVSATPGIENWRKLHKGMKEAEVKQLLGSPTRIVPFTYSVHWFYGSAYVDFDNSRKVQDWHEPK